MCVHNVIVQEHHKFQGDEALDMDIPSRLEGRLFRSTFTKLLWVLLQPVFYTFRPLILNPKPITKLEVANFTAQVRNFTDMMSNSTTQGSNLLSMSDLGIGTKTSCLQSLFLCVFVVMIDRGY
jgi:hypothetical protein